MKKRMCYLLAIMLACCFSCKDKAIVQGGKEDRLTKWEPMFVRYERSQGKSMTALQRVRWCHKSREKNNESLNVEYPVYYGGCADNSTNDSLVIYLTDTSEVVKGDFIRLCRLAPENCVFKKCDYSFNEFEAEIQEIFQVVNKNDKWRIQHCSIDVERNRLVVIFKDDEVDTARKEQFLRELSRPELVILQSFSEHERAMRKRLPSKVFEKNTLNLPQESLKHSMSDVTLIPGGTSIMCNTKLGRVGFGARDFNNPSRKGFVTVAHFGDLYEDAPFYYVVPPDWISPTIANCKKFASYVDAAFCEFVDNFGYNNIYENEFKDFSKDGRYLLYLGERGIADICVWDLYSRYWFGEPYNYYVWCVECQIMYYDESSIYIHGGDSGSLIIDNGGYPVGIAIATKEYGKNSIFYASSAINIAAALDLVPYGF